MYTTTGCGKCMSLKQYLNQHKIKFDEINLSNEPALIDEMIEKSSQFEVPVLDINGRIIVGFDKKKIDFILGINNV